MNHELILLEWILNDQSNCYGMNHGLILLEWIFNDQSNCSLTNQTYNYFPNGRNLRPILALVPTLF